MHVNTTINVNKHKKNFVNASIYVHCHLPIYIKAVMHTTLFTVPN